MAVQERWYPVPFGANLLHYKSLFCWQMDVAKSNTPFLFVALMTCLCMMLAIIPAEMAKASLLQLLKGGRGFYRPVVQLFHPAVAQFATD